MSTNGPVILLPRRPAAEVEKAPGTTITDKAVTPEGPERDAVLRDAQRRPGAWRSSVAGRHPLLSGIALIGLIAGAGAVTLYLDYTSRYVSTDDAFITARQFAIAPKVPGYLTAVPVTDNQHVSTNDVIARIDQRDYRVALAQADAGVAGARAAIANVDAQIDVQKAQIVATEAQVKLSEARVLFAKQESERYQTLTKEGWSSKQTGELATSELYQQQASLNNARAALTVAQRQVEALKAQRTTAEASLRQAEANQDQAKLNLSYTTVLAAQPGRIVQLSGAVGQLAQTGTALSMFVPDEIWVTANFKETQLDTMKAGQPVTFRIDAYPSRTFEGHVASVQPGSGTAFSLLPAQNATGNYVKIVQRVPVKIVIDHAPTNVSLGPGMSVVPYVRTNPSPSFVERLRSKL